MAARKANGQFKKGHSGNPKGRSPREREASYLAAFSRTLKLKDWEKIVEVAIDQAKSGDKDARRFLADYALGKPQQRVELSGETSAIVHVIGGMDLDAI